MKAIAIKLIESDGKIVIQSNIKNIEIYVFSICDLTD